MRSPSTMPELPEVETIARGLQAVLPRSRITNALVRLPKLVKLPLPRFRRQVVGSSVRRVHRRAKLLLVELSSGWTLLIHLKMSGQLIWSPRRGRSLVGGHPIPGGTENLPNQYTHVIIQTNRGRLFFNDQRQFGFMKLIRTAELERWLEAQGYGPEPLEAAFTFNLFAAILRRHRVKRLKPTLLDQRVVAGVGNIYADEACHYAGVKPWRRIRRLTRTEQRSLFRGLRHVLRLAIRHNGTTVEFYRMANGQPGQMNRWLRVYGRTGQPCRRCGATVKKTVLAGRGTHYCSRCQR
jgi:formamidopyrimidine-DNA glycosylase